MQSLKSDIRLGFIGSRSSFVGSGVWTDPPLGRLIDALHAVYPKMTVALSRWHQRFPLHTHQLSLPMNQVAFFPAIESLVQGFWMVPECREIVRKVERQSDVVLFQLPFDCPLALLAPRRPRIYQICINIRTAARATGRRGLAGTLARATGDLINFLHDRLIRLPRTRVVTHGEELMRQHGYPAGQSVVSASLLDHEIMSARRQRSCDSPFRVLYAGYLRRAKGIDTLLSAFASLLETMPNAELCLVGAQEPARDQDAQEIQLLLTALQRRAKVQFLGHRAFGPDLFQCYADADVLVLPSRTEGTPRVLVEARAFGCPVVATNVDGIPSSVTHEIDGLLIPPDHPESLRNALLRIAREPELRARLICNGIKRARQTTIGVFAATLDNEIEKVWNVALRRRPHGSKLKP